MERTLLILLLAMACSAQTRLRPCGVSSSAASGPAVAESARVAEARPPLHPAKSCWCGTVGAASLISPVLSQEVPIVTGLSGSFRFEYVLIQETQQFSSASVNTLSVAAGRPKSGGELVPAFALKSTSAPENFAWVRPQIPVLTGTYDLVLNFVGSAPLGLGGASNFAAGSVNWEVCGYSAQ